MTPVCRGLCRGRCRVLQGTTLGHICGALPWVLSVPQPGPLSCEGGGATPHPPSINCDGGAGDTGSLSGAGLALSDCAVAGGDLI